MYAGSLGTQVQSTITLAFICIMLDVLRGQFASNALADPEPAHVRPIYFYNRTLSYTSYDRIGGLYSFLAKTYSVELAKRLGESVPSAGQDVVDLADMQTTSVPSNTSLCKSIVRVCEAILIHLMGLYRICYF